MHTADKSIGALFEDTSQWVVPIYQRHYTWTKNRKGDGSLQRFWKDLQGKARARLDRKREIPHYFGAILCEEQRSDPRPQGEMSKYCLVDGQQRVTSSQLFIVAMRESARKRGLDSFVEDMDNLLLNRSSDVREREEVNGLQSIRDDDFKLLPSEFDRGLFQAIVQFTRQHLATESCFSKHFKGAGDERALKMRRVPKMLTAYDYLYMEIESFITNNEEHEARKILKTLKDGFLSGFKVVVITLSSNDDAQEIFESLNDIGEPLSPFDLIRNSVYLRARDRREGESLVSTKWKVFESDEWMTPKAKGRGRDRARIEHLLVHTLVAETAEVINTNRIATEYRLYAKERGFLSVVDEIDALIEYSETFRAVEDWNEQKHSDASFKDLARVLEIWDFGVFTPLILWIESKGGVANKAERDTLYKMIESYIVRRSICALGTRRYNNLIPPMIKVMKEARENNGDVAQALASHLQSLTGKSARFPSDSELEVEFKETNAYGGISGPRLRYILYRINGEIGGSRAATLNLGEDLTIDHIMPRGWHKKWQLPCEMPPPYPIFEEAQDLPPMIRDEIRKRESIIHTFGNLTLLTREDNAGAGNEAWDTPASSVSASSSEKCAEAKQKGEGAKSKKCYLKREHTVALHQGILNLTEWNEDEIAKRAEMMVGHAKAIWPYDPPIK